MVKPTQTQSNEPFRKRYSITFACNDKGTMQHVVTAASVKEAFQKCERAHPKNKLLFIGAFDISAAQPVPFDYVAKRKEFTEQQTVPKPKHKKPAKLKKGEKA